MSQLHVNQIETKVRELYATEYWRNDLSDIHNLSRLLGLYAISLEFDNHSEAMKGSSRSLMGQAIEVLTRSGSTNLRTSLF